MIDRALEARGGDGRFEQVILRAGLHRLHRDHLAALTCEHDDGNRHAVHLTSELGQEADTVAVGQAIVEEQAIRRLIAAEPLPRRGGVGLAELPAMGRVSAQVPLVDLAVFRAVVDDQHASKR